MSSVLDEMKQEAVERYKIERAKDLLKIGKWSIEDIAEAIKLSLEKVKELAKQNSSATAPMQGAAQA